MRERLRRGSSSSELVTPSRSQRREAYRLTPNNRMEEEIAKLLVQMRAADEPQDELMLHSQLTRKRAKGTTIEATGSKRSKAAMESPSTGTSGHVPHLTLAMELSPPRGPPASFASDLQPPSADLHEMDANFSSQLRELELMGPSENLPSWENIAKFGKSQADPVTPSGLKFDELFAEGTQCQLKALRCSHIQQALVKHVVSELEGARSELTQLHGRLAESERRLKEEEEARRTEKDRFQKEKEELLRTLKSLEEERSHTQEAVVEAKAKDDEAKEEAQGLWEKIFYMNFQVGELKNQLEEAFKETDRVASVAKKDAERAAQEKEEAVAEAKARAIQEFQGSLAYNAVLCSSVNIKVKLFLALLSIRDEVLERYPEVSLKVLPSFAPLYAFERALKKSPLPSFVALYSISRSK